MNVELIYTLAVLTVVLMISILWTQLIGAPWVPTRMHKVHKMLQMADVGPNDVVYDLGCGDGRTIVTAARGYGARAVGIEVDPLRYTWCQVLLTILGLRGQVQVVLGDLFAQDLSDADVVFCYLLPKTNLKLEGKLKQELPALHAAFVCPRPDGGLCGLVEVSVRSAAPGCKTDRIGYLEAWYVDEDWRGRGVGRALVETAEAWAKAKGCLEMASDTTPDYPLSPGAHEALGYQEVERYFCKKID